MSVENIMIVVYVWHQRMPGSNSSEIFRSVLERAKDLLTTLHSKVIEAESMLQKRIEEQQKSLLALPPVQSTPEKKKISLAARQKKTGTDLITKVYPSDVIPD